MANTENVQLLSKRLNACHELMAEILLTILSWMADGAAKRLGAERGSEYDPVEQDFGSLMITIGYLGEKLAWLENPHAEPLPSLGEMYEIDPNHENNPMVHCDDFPETGIRLLDTVLFLANVANAMDSAAQKLKADCLRERFNNDSDYPDEDVKRACTGLLIDSIHILDQYYGLKPIMVPGAEIDVPGEIKYYLENRMGIQKHETELLRKSLPTDEEIEAAEKVRKEDEEQAKQFFDSWNAMPR
jgi:hypothetical protein